MTFTTNYGSANQPRESARNSWHVEWQITWYKWNLNYLTCLKVMYFIQDWYGSVWGSFKKYLQNPQTDIKDDQ